MNSSVKLLIGSSLAITALFVAFLILAPFGRQENAREEIHEEEERSSPLVPPNAFLPGFEGVTPEDERGVPEENGNAAQSFPTPRVLEEVGKLVFPEPAPSSELVVDLKVNGSDDPGLLSWNSDIIATWNSTGTTYCTGFDELVVDESTATNNLPTAGSLKLKARALVPTFFDNIAVYVACVNNAGKYADDMVLIRTIPSTQPSLDLTSLDSAETAQMGSLYNIFWTSSNLGKVSILLHKLSSEIDGLGEFWYIAKNIPSSGSYNWTISPSMEPDTFRETTSGKISTGDYAIIISDELGTLFDVSASKITIH